MSLRVHFYGEKALRAPVEKVSQFDEDLKALTASMLEALKEAQGIGLAAQHLGLTKAICVIDFSTIKEQGEVLFDDVKTPWALCMPLILINPEIELLGPQDVIAEEGSISFPDISGPIARAEEVLLNYQDTDGKPHTLKASGWLSRCIQHEVDHLNGILYIERMEKKFQFKLKKALDRLKRQVKQKA